MVPGFPGPPPLGNTRNRLHMRPDVKPSVLGWMSGTCVNPRARTWSFTHGCQILSITFYGCQEKTWGNTFNLVLPNSRMAGITE